MELGRRMATQQGERAKKRGENWTETDTERAFNEFMRIGPSQKEQKEQKDFARMLAKSFANTDAKERAAKAAKAQAGKGRRRGTRKGGKRHRRTRKA